MGEQPAPANFDSLTPRPEAEQPAAPDTPPGEPESVAPEPTGIGTELNPASEPAIATETPAATMDPAPSVAAELAAASSAETVAPEPAMLEPAQSEPVPDEPQAKPAATATEPIGHLALLLGSEWES